MKLLILDNYDSFTYNLLHLVKHCGVADVVVKRNDKISLEEVAAFDSVILSPGPGVPSEAGILLDLIRVYGATRPILGVCLGHQAIGEVYGARLTNLTQVVHGKGLPISIVEQGEVIFKDIPDQTLVGRYHSWVVDRGNFPDSLRITAVDAEGYIMALRHCDYSVRGVQFHPESILTEHGARIMTNWLGEVQGK